MRLSLWLTDLADVYRVMQSQDGSFTRQERVCALRKLPCRIAKVSRPRITTIRTRADAADVQDEQMLLCDIAADIRAGDELLILRGGRGTDAPSRYQAGIVQRFHEPFGGIMAGLQHTEVSLRLNERV